MLSLYFSDWTFWESYVPTATFSGQKVTFDGPNKLILINFGVTEIDFLIDIYSNWKEWLIADVPPAHARFLQAMTIVGGQPLPGARKLGTTYFLENGWRIRSWEGDHILNITGNVFTTEGVDPVIPTLGKFKVTVNLNTSNIIDTIETGALIGIDTVTQIDEVHKIHGLNTDNDLVVTDTTRDAGADISQTITDSSGTVTVHRN